MVGGEDARKRCISKLILTEKSWKGTNAVFFKKSKLLHFRTFEFECGDHGVK